MAATGLSADPEEYRRRLTENGELVREKTWNRTIPRDYQ